MPDTEPAPFNCSYCGAKYKIVRVEAPPGPATDRQIVCLSCGGPLNGREVAFLLKYFLIERPRLRRPGPWAA
jgi:hypothetical protein